MADQVDVVLYVIEDPEQEGDLEELLNMYFEFFTHRRGWHRLPSGTTGSVFVASFRGLPPYKVQAILNKVDWGKRKPTALVKQIKQEAPARVPSTSEGE